jgi:chromosome segregation ATPase
MNDSKVYISDYHSLIRLKDALGGCGDSLLNVLHEVDNYLQNMLRWFEEQRDTLKERLEGAKQRLQEAEEALSDCESSQHEEEDEDGHTICITPSCDCEKSNVRAAQQYVDECQRKLDTAERIVSDCKHEVDEYKFRYGILRPNGGEYTLEYIADKHTDEAIRKLEEILDVVVKEYLGRTLIEETGPNEELPMDKTQKFREASEKVKEKQKAEADYNKIASANMSIVCSQCKRPMPICICERGARERGHTNFPQSNRVNQDVFGRIISDYNQNS